MENCYILAVWGTWKSKNRHKYLLQYHIIFVCKYRKKLLVSKQISDDIKQFSYEICQRHKVIIRYMETDKDHIHYMIETEPTMSVSKIVNLMKSYTTYHIWGRYPQYLRKQFWKERTFWTDGYFACSVGNVSEEIILAEFLSKHRAEVIAMSIFEYDKEWEEKKLCEAEYEAGRKDGISSGR